MTTCPHSAELHEAMVNSPEWKQREREAVAATEPAPTQPTPRRLATWLARLLGIGGRA